MRALEDEVAEIRAAMIEIDSDESGQATESARWRRQMASSRWADDGWSQTDH